MAAGYVFDHYNVVTYYMAGGIAFGGLVTVGLAWKSFNMTDHHGIEKQTDEFVATSTHFDEKPTNATPPSNPSHKVNV